MKSENQGDFASYPIRRASLWRPRDRQAGLLFVLPLAVAYLLTLQNGIGWWDSGELVAAAKTLSVAHRPGFPLYILVGRVLFGWLDDPRLVANAFSALSAVFALLFIWRGLVLYQRVSGFSAFWIGAGGWLLGFAPLYWRQAIRAEVYAPTFLALALAFLLAAGAARAPDPRCALRRFLGSAYVAGLAFCLHSALALACWPLLFFQFVAGNFRPSPRQWLWAAGALLLGLSVYLYIPLRAADAWYVWGSPSTLGGFLSYVSAADSFGVIAGSAGGTFTRWFELLMVVRDNVPWILATVGVGGLVYGAFLHRAQGVAPLVLFCTGGVVAATVVSDVIVDNLDLQAYLFPLIWALWWGWSRLDITQLTGLRTAQRSLQRVATIGLTAAVAIFVAAAIRSGAEHVSPLRLGVADQWGTALLASADDNALIVLQDANTDFLVRGLLVSDAGAPAVAVINTAFAPADWYREWWTQRYLGDSAITFGAQPNWPRQVAEWWRSHRGAVLVDYGCSGWLATELSPNGWLARWDSRVSEPAAIPRLEVEGALTDADWVRTAAWFYYRLGEFYRARGAFGAAARAWDEGLRWAPHEQTLSQLRAQIGRDMHALGNEVREGRPDAP